MSIKKRGGRIAVLVFAILAWCAAGAATLTEIYEPGISHYFESFDPAMKPWNPGQDLNVEEVFKNYQYYEIIFDRSGREATVNHYIQNRRERSETYRIRSDGSLELK